VARITFGNVFLCSGTLIAPNTVLTAGHCGSVTGDDVPVSKVTIEPNYLVNSGYDITLLTLSKNSTKTPTKVSGSSEGALWSLAWWAPPASARAAPVRASPASTTASTDRLISTPT
jgi:V8-like Glu-specific endopeptidase